MFLALLDVREFKRLIISFEEKNPEEKYYCFMTKNDFQNFRNRKKNSTKNISIENFLLCIPIPNFPKIPKIILRSAKNKVNWSKTQNAHFSLYFGQYLGYPDPSLWSHSTLELSIAFFRAHHFDKDLVP